MWEKNLAWLASRIVATKIFNVDVEQNVPGWSSFHSMISAKITTPTVIGNCHSVPASPTDISVVYTVPVNIKKVLNNIGQDPAIITCDQGIYSLGKEAQWQVVPQFGSVILCLGGFHRAKKLDGVKGRRMADSGFDEILEESGLYNRNQINGILSGKHYTRSIAAHKQFSEAPYRLYWDYFKCWIENESCKSPPLKRYSVISKNPLKGWLSYGTWRFPWRFPLVKSFKLACR